jgi:hypothetical protein
MKKTNKVWLKFEFKESALKHKSDIPKREQSFRANPAIVDIFERLAKKGIEEPMKFECPSEDAANKLRGACAGYRHAHKLNVHVGMSGVNVYLYNVER